MLKKFLSVILLAGLAAGCGVKAQTYVMTKDRVGIDKLTGNGGYLKGDPKFISPEKKTRKIYVLELTKPLPESEIKKIEEMTVTHTSEVATETVPQVEDLSAEEQEEIAAPIVIPLIEDVPALVQEVITEQGPTVDETYKVLKDDTLQKIAKKFYGSYGKWVKIYEANKDKIKNPNFVRPGTVITIPAVEKK